MYQSTNCGEVTYNYKCMNSKWNNYSKNNPKKTKKKKKYPFVSLYQSVTRYIFKVPSGEGKPNKLFIEIYYKKFNMKKTITTWSKVQQPTKKPTNLLQILTRK